MNKLLLSSLALIGLASSVSTHANTFGLYDDTFSLLNGTTNISTGVYEARWGLWSGSAFTPLLGATANLSNSGYVDMSGPELVANLSQTNNNNIAAGTQLYLAVTLLSDDSSYSVTSTEAVLTDPSWLAPTFVFVANPFVSVTFTNNTTAVKGSFSFNSGNEQINVASATVIPEPSSFAALAGLVAVGMAATRRRRAV